MSPEGRAKLADPTRRDQRPLFPEGSEAEEGSTERTEEIDLEDDDIEADPEEQPTDRAAPDHPGFGPLLGDGLLAEEPAGDPEAPTRRRDVGARDGSEGEEEPTHPVPKRADQGPRPRTSVGDDTARTLIDGEDTVRRRLIDDDPDELGGPTPPATPLAKRLDGLRPTPRRKTPRGRGAPGKR
jgi:hypothetical protein